MGVTCLSQNKYSVCRSAVVSGNSMKIQQLSNQRLLHQRLTHIRHHDELLHSSRCCKHMPEMPLHAGFLLDRFTFKWNDETVLLGVKLK